MKSITSGVSRKQAEELINLPLHLPHDYGWKVLECLRVDLNQFLSFDENETLKLIIRLRDYSSLQILAEDWGLQSIAFSDSPIQSIRAKYQLVSLLKKFQLDLPDVDKRQVAIDGLMASEEKCREFNESSYKVLLKPGGDEWQLLFFAKLKTTMIRILGEELPTLRKFVPWSRHGPGANLDTCEGAVSLYDKYRNWPYSCTLGAYRYARFVIETDQRWYGALQDNYRESLGIPKHYPLDMKRFWTDVIRIVDYNRITTVPKDGQKDRPIAIEPALNLFLQLGVDGFIRRRLLRFNVNLNDQRKNQALARRGSITNRLSTIDLRSASESVSLKLCELILPKPWYNYLCDLRSPYGRLKLGSDEVILKYSKISSMGNGYTFALESAIFLAVVIAAMEADGARINYDEIAIYGDDIIIPSEHYSKVVRALHLCGFATNTDKTFQNGPIRESCGTDWFQGTPIRPVFFKSQPKDVTGLYNDYNRLKRVLSIYFGLSSEESKACQRIYRWIPLRMRYIVGPYSDTNFDGYIHTSAPNSAYSFCMYSHWRLYQKPASYSAPDFHMRKLMHQLRGEVDSLLDVYPEREKGNGSVFTPMRKANRVGITVSRLSHWEDEYDELAYKQLR